jgi:glycosyltransferase involved in cell wall biosynthesis
MSSGPSPDVIPSAQRRADGSPRFLLRRHEAIDDWDALVALEADGGVAAEIRLFLEAQMDADDLLVDLSPGAGFVALGAATLESRPHVVCAVGSDAQDAALRDAADAADAFLETMRAALPGDATARERVVERVAVARRVFVHADVATSAPWLDALAPQVASGAIVAWCVTGAGDDDAWRLLRERLGRAGLVSHWLVDGAEGPMLVPAPPEARTVIAVHVAALEGATDAPARTPPAAASVVVRDAAAAPAPDVLAPVAAPPSMNFLAPFCRTGYGIAGAYLLRAVLAQGVPAAFFPIGALDRALLPFEGLDDALGRQADFDPDAPSVRLAQQFDLALHAGRGPRLGFPIFEVNRFGPRALHHLAAQDRLLVCSAWARGVLLENGLWRQPIDIVPLGVDRAVFHERLDPGPARDETVFLQVGKLEPRKGQRELLAAFEAAFTPSDKVRLVLACHNPFLAAEAMAAATAPFRRSRLAARITLHLKPFATHGDVARLMASADCGVFASRAEGWNLEALELLSCGREVIATAYSGHTAFLTAENARLVEIDALEDAIGFSDDGGAWAAWGPRQHEQLVEHLRAVHARRREGPLPLNAAGVATAEAFSWDRAAAVLMRAVREAVR